MGTILSWKFRYPFALFGGGTLLYIPRYDLRYLNQDDLGVRMEFYTVGCFFFREYGHKKLLSF